MHRLLRPTIPAIILLAALFVCISSIGASLQVVENQTPSSQIAQTNVISSPSPIINNSTQSEKIVSIWNALVQTLVLIVVFFYTYQTKKMQTAMVRQIKLSLMPSFTLELVQLNVTDPTLELNTYALQITNIGSGTALNVQAQPVLLPELITRRRKVGCPNVKFQKIGLLRRDQTLAFAHQSFSDDQLVEDNYMIDLESAITSGRVVEVVITFQDIEGDTYRQSIRITPNGCEPEAVIPR